MTLSSTNVPSPIGFETMSPAMRKAANYHRWVLSLIGPRLCSTDSLLEVGPGFGIYTPELRRQVKNLAVTDLSDACLRHLRRTVGEIPTIRADLGTPEFAAEFGKEAFDKVVALNVLEHIPDDRQAIRNIAAVLKPGGMAILQVPALPALYGPMDRQAGHCRRYSLNELQNSLQAGNFLGSEVFFFNPLGGVAWYLQANCSSAQGLADRLVNRRIAFFDAVVLPLSRLLSPLFSGFFGQSLWAFATKRL